MTELETLQQILAIQEMYGGAISQNVAETRELVWFHGASIGFGIGFLVAFQFWYWFREILRSRDF